MALVIGLVTGAVQLWDLYRERTRPQPRLAGELNIAVAAFAETDDRGRPVDSPRGAELATSVANRLGTELASLRPALDVQVGPPADIGRVRGRTREERARSALEISRRRNATLVVHGVLATGLTGGSLTPELYVDRSVVPDAEELTGGHSLGNPIPVPGGAAGNPVVNAELVRPVIARTRALAEFAIGLGYRVLGRATEADAAFRRAVDAHGWEEGGGGKELLYLFLGNAAGARRDYPRAEAAYKDALRLNPGYARAQIGLAEVRYHRASGEQKGRSCLPGGVDPVEMSAAAAAYRLAGTMTDRPTLARIDAKTALGLGRVSLCLGLAGLGGGEEAERRFRAVVAMYDGGDLDVRQLAVEALAGLATVAGFLTTGGDTAARRQRATDSCRRAIELTQTSARRGSLYALLGSIELQFGDRVRAAESYRRAAEADPARAAEYLDEYRRRTR